MHDVFILAARRTPITARSRALATYTADELGAVAARAAIADSGHTPDTVLYGDSRGPGGNLARIVALGAGLPNTVPGVTIDAQCGSGLVTLLHGVDHVALRGGIALVGGAESTTNAPERLENGIPYARARFVPRGWPDPGMTEAAADLAREAGISRERQDAFALRSHLLALRAAADGAFRREIAAVDTVASDDGPRDLGERALSRFGPIHPELSDTLTPGNTARISDGAAALVLAADPVAGVPRIRVVATALTAGDHELPGLCPIAAIRQVLDAAGVQASDVGHFELVEAFASQSLAVLDAFDLAHGTAVSARVNADGGALALGHPWAASGAVAATRLYSRMLTAQAGTLGIAACAIGGGMGAAVLVVKETP